METGPPALVEAIVATVVPPAAREHLVGDLRERFTSTRQYLLDAARIVPLVILSQVRRTADSLLVVIQAYMLCLVFRDHTWLNGSAAVIRTAIPIGAALLFLLLRDAYANPRPRHTDPDVTFDRALMRSVGDAAGGVLAAWLSQVIASRIHLNPDWLLSRATLTTGVLGGFLMLVPARIAWEMLFRGADTTRRPAGSRALIRDPRSRLDHGRIGSFMWLGITSQTARIGWQLLTPSTPADRLLGAVILVAAGHAGYRLVQGFVGWYRRPDPLTIAFFGTALERQRDVFSHAWAWYVAPFVLANLVVTLKLILDNPQRWGPTSLQFAFTIASALVLGGLSQRWAGQLKSEVRSLKFEVEGRSGSSK